MTPLSLAVDTAYRNTFNAIWVTVLETTLVNADAAALCHRAISLAYLSALIWFSLAGRLRY